MNKDLNIKQRRLPSPERAASEAFQMFFDVNKYFKDERTRTKRPTRQK